MRKKNKSFSLLVFLLCLLSFPASSQDIDAHSPRPYGSSHQQLNAEKKKAKLQKKIERGVDKARKQHLKLQTKNTKKMMRESKRKAKKWNSNR